MTNRQKAIAEFREAADQPIRTEPTIDIPHEEKVLAVRLIAEELEELAEALDNDDLIEVADAAADLDVVVQQLGPTFGLPMDRLFDEVHRSNMSKVDPATGKMPKNPETGKAMKGPNYFAPDIEAVLLGYSEPELPEFEDIDPRVDLIIAPTLAAAKAIIPLEHPELIQLPAFSPLHLRRSGALHGRHVRNAYVFRDVVSTIGSEELFEELEHRIAQSGLGGRIITLRH